MPYAFTNFAGLPGGWGTNDGTGSAGNVFAADTGNNRITKGMQDSGPQIVFVDWTALDLTNGVAVGTLGGIPVTFYGGDTNLYYSGLDGSAWFDCAYFSPPLPQSDFVYVAATQVSRTYSFEFGGLVRDPVIDFQSLGSQVTFSVPATLLSGSPQFTVSGSTVSGAGLDGPDACGFNDSSGTIQLEGVFSSIPFNLQSAYVIDGIRIQLGGIPVMVTNLPPTVSCLAASTNECGAAVVLSAEVNDPEGDALTVVWSVNGEVVDTNQLPSIQPPAARIVSLGVIPPLGTNIIEVAAQDSAGYSVSCSSLVTVVDTTPPTLVSASANPSILWPPDHRLVLVGVSAQVTDQCGLAAWKITGVLSSEPPEGGDSSKASSDWVIVNNHQVLLRSERSGGGNGRVYSISIQATDSSGNSTAGIVTVTVPHSQGGSDPNP